MNVYNFLENLSHLYEVDKNQEYFKERVERYVKILSQTEANNSSKIDYESTLDKIIVNYPFRIYPNFTEILKNLVYFPKEKKTNRCITNPRRFQVTAFGHEYDFIEVPSSHTDAHSLSEFGDNVVEIF